jgi:VanZ family protein
MKIVFAVYTSLIVAIFLLAYKGLIPVEIGLFPYYDSIGHFVLYGTWGYLAGRAFNKNINYCIKIPKGLLAILVVSILEELAQSFSGLRTFSLIDLFSGVFGICLSYAIIKKQKTSVDCVYGESVTLIKNKS